MLKESLIDKLWVALFRIPVLKNYWARSYEAVLFDHVPWTKLNKPLPECKIALFTTGGIHLKSDKAFNLIDPTWRQFFPPNSLQCHQRRFNHFSQIL